MGQTGEGGSTDRETPVQDDFGDYSREAAYNAVKSLYRGENDVVKDYISPIQEYDEGMYDGPAPLEEFEEKFEKALMAYDSNTKGEFDPVEESIYAGLDEDILNEKEPVTGEDIANAFLAAGTVEEAIEELERFGKWMDPLIDNTTFEFSSDREPLEGEQYQEMATIHGFRRLIQRKYLNREKAREDLFEAPDSGRKIDLASRV